MFLIGQYYGGLCNGVEDCSADVEQRNLEAATSQGVEVGPDVYVIEGDGLWSPPAEVVERARAAAGSEAARFEAHPGSAREPAAEPARGPALALLLIVPGWLASNWLGIRTTVDRIALIPGMSVVIVLLAGIAVLAFWRGPLSVAKGWSVVAVAIGVGAALRVADVWLRRPLEAFGGFFNSMFSAFSNRDFSVLMGVQFLAQAGQGVVQGAIAKSLAFGGQEGFDVQNLPSADYLLTVVLALYVPYTLISPFIGVFIDCSTGRAASRRSADRLLLSQGGPAAIRLPRVFRERLERFPISNEQRGLLRTVLARSGRPTLPRGSCIAFAAR